MNMRSSIIATLSLVLLAGHAGSTLAGFTCDDGYTTSSGYATVSRKVDSISNFPGYTHYTEMTVVVSFYPGTYYYSHKYRPLSTGTCTDDGNGYVYISTSHGEAGIWSDQTDAYGSTFIYSSGHGAGGQQWIAADGYCSGTSCY
jgi:hypothetical protein